MNSKGSGVANTEPGPVGSLERGLHLLSQVAAAQGPISLGDLARRAGLDKATTYRLICKLTDHGYVLRDRRGRYSLSLRVLDLGVAYLAALELRQQAEVEMRQLHIEYDGSITLSVLDRTEIVYIERILPKRLRSTLPIGIGRRLPVHCSAMGKAILAYTDSAELAVLLDGLTFQKWTRRTIGTRATFDAELKRTRRRGFAIVDGELIPGVRAVASPILDRQGHATAALAVSLPGHLFSVQQLAESVGPRVVSAAQAISSRLGTV